jgi:hypothetical protein
MFMTEGAGGSFDQEHEPGWKQAGIEFDGGLTALRIYGDRGAKYRIGREQFKYDPSDMGQRSIVRTKSGNEYYIADDRSGSKFIVNINETINSGSLVAAYATELEHQVPPIEFHKPWNTPGFYTTSNVLDILVQYKGYEPGKSGFSREHRKDPFIVYNQLLADHNDQA